ncbi:oxidoreductase [Streptomyces sp. SID13666]|uniref:oxidoreductase n=1 Tax=unclassified Streptomyces TaxID=2593676 RepID=UPI0013C0ED84|nr:oxidoreductase [Streptomyces sp. SID13666]NEA74459.1 oxidoreductase [Streptomyces sp. SID13588]
MTEPSGIRAPGDWTEPEKDLWTAFRRGVVHDLRTGIPERDDPATDRAWGPERTVRAEVIATLLLDGPPAEPGRVACVKLSGARISGQLNLSGGQVTPYVEMHDCHFDQQILLPECQFTTLRMVHCSIPRLEAARLTTTGDLHLPQCSIEGGIRLTDAHIGTDLLLNQLTVGRDRHGRAIAADGLSVAQDVEAELMDVTGEISLRSARIGGRLSLRGSLLHNPYGRYALNAARVTVEHTLYLSAGWMATGGDSGGTPPAGVRTRNFSCEGAVRLDDGRFGNAVIITRARFRLTGSQQLSLRRIQTPELRFTLSQPPTGTVSLAGARVGNLTDTRQSWPESGGLDLAGFSYTTLSPAGAFPLRDRIAWLAAATPEYSPEPYEHLAAALRAGGEDSDAREVLLAKQRRRREALPLAGTLWGYLQDMTVGYGYRPGRAAVWMAVLWAIGATFFSLHAPPALKPDEAPHWSAPLYALDLLLPVIDLGQDSAWKPSGGAQWAATVLVLLGWILATTVAAGASRLLRRG